ncbi:DUF3892 domain-containing protein [Lactococcus allomyrinae]|uniref:DUF3892 domain-containing protein n=1 Tax=Lactococcus allomyrinae TaxID=2419773 RepID=A0A387BEV1_9LACT|nr:DUF3892 domain-containing protein [Lactococcus allomyrinae]AYG00109.1 DUF3892 domain-containing protein [Lactococcus allomyrinae]
MEYQITHIRVSDNYVSSTDKITDVKLSSDLEYSVADIIRFINNDSRFFYTCAYSQADKVYLEAVCSANGILCLHTEANPISNDNLLSLPRF